MDYTFTSDKEQKPGQEKVEEKAAVIKTAKQAVNVRKGPSMSDSIVRVLQGGDTILIKENLGEWSKTADGHYIMSQYLA